MWYFPDATMLLVFRSLSGAAAASWVSFTVLFSSYFNDDEAPKAMGFITAVTSLGQVVAIFFGGLAAQSFGQRAPFLLAVFGGAAGLALSLGVVESKELQREPVKITGLLNVARDGNLLLLSVLAVLIQFMVFATVYGFTPVAAKQIGATPFQMGLITTISTIPGIFSAALSGSFFSKYLGEKRTIVTGFAVSAAACIVIPFVRELTLLYITQMVAGFSQSMVFPLLMGLCIRNVSANKRSTTMGFFQAIYGFGMFLGPVVVGFLGDTAGLSWGFIVTGLVGVMGAVITALFMKSGQAQVSAVEG
jgi:MFS family permease